MNQLKLDVNRSQPRNLSTTNEDHVHLLQWSVALTLIARLVAYFAILALLVLVVLLILKYIANFDEEEGSLEEITADETNPLRTGKATGWTYGSCENDLESGNCGSSTTSSEDLYDAKLCVICYDEQRNCFFVPCGHCATCSDCAQRIFSGENKTCPVCRRLIGRVRRLFTS